MLKKTPILSIREQIADHLRSDILTGQLTKGERLHEHALAQRFGVSRGPIRDVLLQLTQEGLLISKPNCGVKVGATLDEWIQPLVVDLRLRIEVFALKKVFEKLNDDAILKLEADIEELYHACNHEDIAAVAKCDMAFHRHILEITEDKDLVAIWLPIVVRMMLHYTRHKDMMENYYEHLAILNAIRARDAQKAQEALIKNIQ